MWYFRTYLKCLEIFSIFKKKFFSKIFLQVLSNIVTTWNCFYSRAINNSIIIGAYILLLCFNFSHEKSILRAADLKYTLMSSRTRAFSFFFFFSRTKILCERSNSSKTIFGNKETKEMIKRQPWKFLIVENGCVHERIESF